MTVAAPGVPDAVRATLESWGWQLSEEHPDAILTISGQSIEIRTSAALHADDIAFLPLQEEVEAFLEGIVESQLKSHIKSVCATVTSPLTGLRGFEIAP